MGSRPGASPAFHGCLGKGRTTMAGNRTCSLDSKRQLNWGTLSLSLLPGQTEVAVLPVEAILCPNPSCPDHCSLYPYCWAGQPKAGRQQAVHEASRPGIGSSTQPLGPASSLKLNQSFLFGAGDAKAPPPPLFCRDHRSICCPHGGAPRQYHTGAAPQKTLLAASLIGSKAVPAAG